MNFDVVEFVTRMADKGVICKPTHGYILRIIPPLVIEKKHADKFYEVLTETLVEFENRVKD